MRWELSSKVESFKEKTVLVIGDLILDRYIYGDVSRISPEAPIPILKIKKEEFILGGAANTAHNVVSVGGNAVVVGVLGKDAAAKKFLGLMKQKGIDTSGIIAINRPTIEKTRYIGKTQQLLRTDFEETSDISDAQGKMLFTFLQKKLPEIDIVVISDYAKGTITEKLCKAIIKLCNDKKVKVIVDTRPQHREFYKNAYLITPNFKESKELMKEEGEDTDEFVKQLGKKMVKNFNSNIIMTRGSRGMAIFGKNKNLTMLPTKAREVFDVSGAGDTVVAILALSLAAGLDLVESAKMANHAGGIVVGKMGTATVSEEELKSILREDIVEYLRAKIDVTEKVLEVQLGDIENIVKEIINVYSNGKKVLLFGNGGSASDAQHMAGELVGRFKIERRGLPAIALTTDSSIITSVANDYSYDVIFSRQIEALGNEGDVAIGFTTSGNSPNIVEAFKLAHKNKMKTILITGKTGGKAKEYADISVIVPSDDTPLIQETHISLIHIMCDLLDKTLYGK